MSYHYLVFEPLSVLLFFLQQKDPHLLVKIECITCLMSRALWITQRIML